MEESEWSYSMWDVKDSRDFPTHESQISYRTTFPQFPHVCMICYVTHARVREYHIEAGVRQLGWHVTSRDCSSECWLAVFLTSLRDLTVKRRWWDFFRILYHFNSVQKLWISHAPTAKRRQFINIHETSHAMFEKFSFGFFFIPYALARLVLS